METMASADVNVNRIDSDTRSETNGGGYEERVKVDRKKFEQMINGEFLIIYLFCEMFFVSTLLFQARIRRYDLRKFFSKE